MGASARTSAFRYGLLALAVALLTSAAAATAPPAQAGVTVLGAGSTWDQIATTQWAADVHTLYGITINYQGVGSTAGRQFYIENQVDFGDSDIPFQNTPNENELAELASEHKTYQYLPTVAGATGLMYNLRTPSGKKIENLRLDSHALTGIFTGTIKSWTDPAITKQNPQLRGQLPHTAIIPVVRADGSGTSAMFSDYLRQLQPAMWRHFCSTYHISPCGEISFWPLDIAGSVAQKGSDGVANYVQQQTNSITYVETGYALARNFPVVYVRNQSGHYVFPSSQADATALRHARIRSDLISDLSGVHTAPEAGAYPIAGYSYMITPTKLQYGFTTAKGAVLGKYILYSACAGQKKAASLGYAPLTPVLVKGVFAAVRRIPGAPTPPPLSQCANPTLTGAPTSSATSESRRHAAAARLLSSIERVRARTARRHPRPAPRPVPPARRNGVTRPRQPAGAGADGEPAGRPPAGRGQGAGRRPGGIDVAAGVGDRRHPGDRAVPVGDLAPSPAGGAGRHETERGRRLT